MYGGSIKTIGDKFTDSPHDFGMDYDDMPIQKQLDTWIRDHGLVPHGECVVTNAGFMPCKMVIHAVGCVYTKAGFEPALWYLHLIYTNVLKMA